jgi:tRNA (guanine-N7-)-methyltransferase
MNQPPLRTYGRTKARTLKPRQAALVDVLLPHLAVPEQGEIDLAALFATEPPPRGAGVGGGGVQDMALSSAHLQRELGSESTQSIAPPPYPPPKGGGVVLEIGFGGGEHLVAQAAAYPGARFIGVEPFLNGVASCLRHIEESGVQNVRLHQGDAREVMARLPDGSLDLVYILFPDPWPKARHHKRRLIQAEFLDALARVMKPGAEVRFATDWANYAEWALEHLSADARFASLSEKHDAPWPGHVTTRYEAKRLGDCAPVWLRFVKR